MVFLLYIEVLLEGNMDPNIQDCIARPAVFFAAENGHEDIVTRLLEAGANHTSK